MHPKLTGYWIQGKTVTVLPPHTVLNIQQYSVAFDKVPHKRMVKKTEAKESEAGTASWIESWLSDRTQREKPEDSPVDSGVPQVVFRIRIY